MQCLASPGLQHPSFPLVVRSPGALISKSGSSQLHAQVAARGGSQLVGNEEELKSLADFLRGVADEQENNSLLLVGHRGSGLSTVLLHALRSIASASSSSASSASQAALPFKLVYLNGELIQDDSDAVREISSQLSLDVDADVLQRVVSSVARPQAQGQGQGTGHDEAMAGLEDVEDAAGAGASSASRGTAGKRQPEQGAGPARRTPPRPGFAPDSFLTPPHGAQATVSSSYSPASTASASSPSPAIASPAAGTAGDAGPSTPAAGSGGGLPSILELYARARMARAQVDAEFGMGKTEKPTKASKAAGAGTKRGRAEVDEDGNAAASGAAQAGSTDLGTVLKNLKKASSCKAKGKADMEEDGASVGSRGSAGAGSTAAGKDRAKRMRLAAKRWPGLSQAIRAASSSDEDAAKILELAELALPGRSAYGLGLGLGTPGEGDDNSTVGVESIEGDDNESQTEGSKGADGRSTHGGSTNGRSAIASGLTASFARQARMAVSMSQPKPGAKATGKGSTPARGAAAASAVHESTLNSALELLMYISNLRLGPSDAISNVNEGDVLRAKVELEGCIEKAKKNGLQHAPTKSRLSVAMARVTAIRDALDTARQHIQQRLYGDPGAAVATAGLSDARVEHLRQMRLQGYDSAGVHGVRAAGADAGGGADTDTRMKRRAAVVASNLIAANPGTGKTASAKANGKDGAAAGSGAAGEGNDDAPDGRGAAGASGLGNSYGAGAYELHLDFVLRALQDGRLGNASTGQALATAAGAGASSSGSSSAGARSSPGASSGRPCPVFVIIDRFDVFARKTRQTLLYSLLDLTQSPKVHLAVIGLTNNTKTVEMLEKRLKSRFSSRQIVLRPPSRGSHVLALVRQALQAPAGCDSVTASAWDTAVRRILTDRAVLDIAAGAMHAGKNAQWYVDWARRALGPSSRAMVTVAATATAGAAGSATADESCGAAGVASQLVAPSVVKRGKGTAAAAQEVQSANATAGSAHGQSLPSTPVPSLERLLKPDVVRQTCGDFMHNLPPATRMRLAGMGSDGQVSTARAGAGAGASSSSAAKSCTGAASIALRDTPPALLERFHSLSVRELVLLCVAAGVHIRDSNSGRHAVTASGKEQASKLNFALVHSQLESLLKTLASATNVMGAGGMATHGTALGLALSAVQAGFPPGTAGLPWQKAAAVHGGLLAINDLDGLQAWEGLIQKDLLRPHQPLPEPALHSAARGQRMTSRSTVTVDRFASPGSSKPHGLDRVAAVDLPSRRAELRWTSVGFSFEPHYLAAVLEAATANTAPRIAELLPLAPQAADAAPQYPAWHSCLCPAIAVQKPDTAKWLIAAARGEA